MTIPKMIERSNPEDMPEPAGPISGQKGSGQAPVPKNILIIGILILSSSASFGLGVLTGQSGNSASNGHGLVVSSVPLVSPGSGQITAAAISATGQGQNTSSTTGSAIPAGGEVVAAKSTHSYYLPWCAQAAKISNADKVWFSSEQAALAAGYAAGNGCAGI